MGEATRARNTEAIQSLQRVGLPPYAGGDGWDVLDKQVRSFARREFQGGVKTSTLGGLALRSRDYSLGDKIKILAGYGFSVSALWSELYKIDLFREAKRIDVPVYLISGRHDRVAAEGAVRHFLDSLEAPAGKRLILFNDSAHWPMFEESDRFCAELIAISRATAQRR